MERSEVTTRKLELTPTEQQLYDELDWRSGEHEAYLVNRPRVTALMRSLQKRGAIPTYRNRYFVDAECNPGGRARSRRDVFVENGCRTDEEIISHPSFLKYLRYFIEGPALPAAVIKGFQAATAAPFREWNALSVYVRAQARQFSGMTAEEMGEEFLKLALEFGLDPQEAASLRTAARKARIRR